MYRDDKEALQARADAATREADVLRRENEAIRRAVATTPGTIGTTLALPPAAVYSSLDVRQLPLAERARLAQHHLKEFPVVAVAVLNVVTLGLFPLIHFGLMHDRLPRAAANDPSAGKAIGFSFIPYYNLYWVFFNALRLADRIGLQYRLRGRRSGAPRGLLIAAAVCTVIPYVNILVGIPILWTIAVCFLQSSVNEVAAMPHDSWDATEPTSPPVGLPAGTALLEPSPAQRAELAKARKLVNLSHILGWGGLVMLVAGTAAGFAIAGAGLGLAVAAIAGVAVIAGAVIGQVGRGMQGRVI